MMREELEVERLCRELLYLEDAATGSLPFTSTSLDGVLRRPNRPRLSDQVRELRLALVALDLARKREGKR